LAMIKILINIIIAFYCIFITDDVQRDD